MHNSQNNISYPLLHAQEMTQNDVDDILAPKKELSFENTEKNWKTCVISCSQSMFFGATNLPNLSTFDHQVIHFLHHFAGFSISDSCVKSF